MLHEIPGGWTERELTLAGRTWRLTMPRDPDEFVYFAESLPPAEQSRTDVFWAHLWSAARPLAEQVVAAKWPLGATAIELGCGLGWVGLAAAQAGLHVTFSDYVSQAVELAVLNARRNGFADAEGLVLDWRSPPQRTFDVVLASDVLYYARFHAALLDTIDVVLAPAGRCWIGDSGRPQAAAFVELAARRFVVRLDDEHGTELTSVPSQRFVRVALARK